MKKMLYILNIANRVNNFSYTSMKAAQELGFDYHIAGNWNYASDEERIEDEKKFGIHIYQIDFIRTPYHPGNIKAYKQLKEIVEREKFDVIHCNTPIGGVVGRLLGKSCKVPTVIYQAHGFHFYKGAPVLNWFLYYPVEKALARNTDILITINSEDHQLAKKKFKLKNNAVCRLVHGVGIDNDYYRVEAEERQRIFRKKREELGLNNECIVLISIGEINKNKNNKTIIEALGKVKNPNIHLLLCGIGPESNTLMQLTERLKINKQVHFLGFRTDIKDLIICSDIFVMASYREGLSRSIMEAMACKKPCIVSNIRGNTDLIENEKQGILCSPHSIEQYSNAITLLAENDALREIMASESIKKIEMYNTDTVTKELRSIYEGINHR